jgi:hypothetical protein
VADFAGPIHLAREPVAQRIPTVPGTYALGYARPQEGAVFVSYVGRADRDLQSAVLDHVGGPYTACFWLAAKGPEAAFREECRLWHEMGGETLDSAMHPVPPGDLPCPLCG